MRRTSLTLLAGIALAAFPALSQAHFLWASFDAGKPRQITIELAETPGDSTVPGVAGKADAVKGCLSKGRSLKLDKIEKGLTATLGDGENVAGASVLYGVLDRSEQNRGVFLLNYFAKAAKDPAAATFNLGMKTEIIGTVVGNKLVLTTLYDHSPAVGAEVNVLLGGAAPVDLKSDKNGQVEVDYKPGQTVAARAMVAENRTGEAEGKKYSLVRNYATLAIGSPKPAAPATDPKAYSLLKTASDARASFPANLLGFTADVSAEVEGRKVSGKVTFDQDAGVTAELKGEAKDQEWVKGQLRSLILHRSNVPFEKGDGAYPITFTGSENALGTEIAIGDSMNSRYRIKGDEILEVDREIGGGKLVVCVLDSIRTKLNRTLSTQMSVCQFTMAGALQWSQMISDQYVELGGGVFPSIRRVLSTTDKGITTKTLNISNLKLVQS